MRPVRRMNLFSQVCRHIPQYPNETLAEESAGHWWLIVVRSCQELLACTSMLVVRWNFIVEATKQCIILWSDAGDPLPAWNIFLTLSNTYSPSFIYLTLSSLVRFSPCPNTLFKGRRPTFLVAQQLYGHFLLGPRGAVLNHSAETVLCFRLHVFLFPPPPSQSISSG